MMVHRGPARIFESRKRPSSAILAARVKPGDVVVIRYEGPKGGPGMQEMLGPDRHLMGMGLGEQRGADHRRPLLRRHARRLHRPRLTRGRRRRADRAGPEGDIISIDIPNNRLDVELDELDMSVRRRSLKPFRQTIDSKYLRRYAHLVTSANTGAVLRDPQKMRG